MDKLNLKQNETTAFQFIKNLPSLDSYEFGIHKIWPRSKPEMVEFLSK